MAYRFQRDTPRDRVRSVVGDTSDPPLMAGGEGAYDAIVTAAATEHAAAATAARDLAAQLSKRPDSLSDAGSGLAWRERVSFLLQLATGAIGTGLAGDPALTGALKAATGISLRGRPRPDYTLATGDVIEEEEES